MREYPASVVKVFGSHAPVTFRFYPGPSLEHADEGNTLGRAREAPENVLLFDRARDLARVVDAEARRRPSRRSLVDENDEARARGPDPPGDLRLGLRVEMSREDLLLAQRIAKPVRRS